MPILHRLFDVHSAYNILLILNQILGGQDFYIMNFTLEVMGMVRIFLISWRKIKF